MITINTIIIDADAKTVEPLVIEIGSHKDNILDVTRHITGHNDPGIEGEYGKTPEVWFLCEDDPHTGEAPLARFRDWGALVGKTIIIASDEENDCYLDCPFSLEEARAATEFYFGKTYRRSGF